MQGGFPDSLQTFTKKLGFVCNLNRCYLTEEDDMLQELGLVMRPGSSKVIRSLWARLQVGK